MAFPSASRVSPVLRRPWTPAAEAAGPVPGSSGCAATTSTHPRVLAVTDVSHPRSAPTTPETTRPHPLRHRRFPPGTYAKLGLNQGWFAASLTHPSSRKNSNLCFCVSSESMVFSERRMLNDFTGHSLVVSIDKILGTENLAAGGSAIHQNHCHINFLMSLLQDHRQKVQKSVEYFIIFGYHPEPRKHYLADEMRRLGELLAGDCTCWSCFAYRRSHLQEMSNLNAFNYSDV